VIIDCRFETTHWPNNLNLYTCWSSAKNSRNALTIDEVRGDHLSGKSNVDVQAFREANEELQHIPSNLVRFFPNLKVIYFDAPLLQISASDLKPFPNLVQFYSFNSKFTRIESDLFQSTKKLQTIQFRYSMLENVGENLLSGLSQLKDAQFYRCTCIGFTATTRQTIEELKQKLATQCPHLRATTASPLATTPGLSTTTTSKRPPLLSEYHRVM
jgi:hypothetical protein